MPRFLRIWAECFLQHTYYMHRNGFIDWHNILMKKEVRGIIRFATTFSNAAYMGFPLIQAMYGSEGVLYASVYVTVFNILLWTVGIVYVSESMSFKELLKKIVTCPPIISVAVGLVIFLARIPVADVLKDTFNVVGGMNTPLSMIITGITISQFQLLSILKDKRVYLQLFSGCLLYR